jgi:DNA-directed RNA polymerase II subunit RPB2
MESAFSEFVCAYAANAIPNRSKVDPNHNEWGENTSEIEDLSNKNIEHADGEEKTVPPHLFAAFVEMLQKSVIHDLVSHQTDSFALLYDWLVQMYMSTKPLRQIKDGYLHEICMYSVNFCQPCSKEMLSPYMCRIMRITYDLDIMGIVEYKVFAPCDASTTSPGERHTYATWDGKYFTKEPAWSHRSEPLKIGVLPLMTHAKGCMEREGKVHVKEIDPKNYGGNFIIGGSCKVMPPVERLLMNHPLLFSQTGTYSHCVEFRSQHSSRAHRSSSNVKILMSRLYKRKPRRIMVTIPYAKQPMPLMVLFLALGWTKRQVLVAIRTCAGKHFHADFLELLESLFYATEKCKTQHDALLCLAKYAKKDYKGKTERSIIHSVRYSLRTEVFPHLGFGGEDMSDRKGATLCDLLWRLLMFSTGRLPATDRRALEYIRYDAAAFSIINIMYQLWGLSMRKSMTLFREMLFQNKNVEYAKLFNGHTTTSRLLDCIGTGMWAAKKTNDEKRSGMSHLQDRTNISGSIAQLRQVHSSNSKNDKNEARRQIADHSRGRICPTETPEGQNVGIVKYLALGARLTIGSDPTSLMYVLLSSMDWIPLSFMHRVAQGERPWGRHMDVFRAWEQNHQTQSTVGAKGDTEEGESCNEETDNDHTSDHTIDDDADHNDDFLRQLEMDTSDLHAFFVNGTWYGWIRNPAQLRERILQKRRTLSCDPDTACSWSRDLREIRIDTDAGKVVRPVGIGPRARQVLSQYSEKSLPLSSTAQASYGRLQLQSQGLFEYLDAAEETGNGKEEWERQGYFELDKAYMVGLSTAMNPLFEHNQVCRNLFQASMGKQATMVWGTRPRGDMSNFELQTGQRPLVHSSIARQLGLHHEMTGRNVRVLISTLWAYTSEDALAISKRLLDHRAFHMYSNRRYSAKEAKHGANNNIDSFGKPDARYTSGMREANYDLLEDDGLVPKNTAVDETCMLIGKVGPGHQISTAAKAVVPKSMQSREKSVYCDGAGGDDTMNSEHPSHSQVTKYRDQSISVRKGEGGVVVNTLLTTVHENRTAKVHVRIEKVPELGDKFSSRFGQKGTIGVVMAPEDMPFDSHGEPVDIVMNPHGHPTRKTEGQNMEGYLGLAAVWGGGFVESKPFANDIEALTNKAGKILHGRGFSATGKEVYHDGRTGEPMQGVLASQRVYYQRLHHNPGDKKHSVDLRGPTQIVTGQRRQGKKRNGATRFGSMENDAMWTHGSAEIQRERMVDFSDKFTCYVCHLCGFLGEANPAENLFYCRHCDVSNSLWQLDLPKTFRVHMHEQMSNGVRMQFILEKEDTFGELVWCSSAKRSHPALFRVLDFTQQKRREAQNSEEPVKKKQKKMEGGGKNKRKVVGDRQVADSGKKKIK